MVNFVKTYGTHYHGEITFGAEMIYERRFSSTSKKEEDKETREKCTGNILAKKFQYFKFLDR